MLDPRYSELLFLLNLAKSSEYFQDQNGERSKAAGISPTMDIGMAATLIEELYVRFDNDQVQLLVARLRGELPTSYPAPGSLDPYLWNNPRASIRQILMRQSLPKLCIT